MIGATPAYISKLLRGATNFTLDTMVKIAAALDCEFRCHLQPAGAQSQWLDVYSSKTLKTSSTTSDAAKNIVWPAQFKPVELPINMVSVDEKRAALA